LSKDCYFRQIFASLKKDLARQGFEDVIIHDSKNAYSVDVALIHCDYYDYITGKTTAGNTYQGEFMNQYSWAEQYIYSLENI
jgi:two-component SAPR family response regulator